MVGLTWRAGGALPASKALDGAPSRALGAFTSEAPGLPHPLYWPGVFVVWCL